MEYKKKITTDLISEILSKGVKNMPRNPASKGLAMEQIREFYYVPEEETLNLLLSIEEEIEKVINDIKYLFVIVDELPEASKDTIGKIYLVENETSSDGNKYTEFLTIEKDNVYYWERIGLKEINIVYDDELSLSSENPIKNKVVTKALQDKVDKNSLATINGQSLINGGDIKVSGGNSEVDTELSTESTNPVQNKVVTEALNKKLDKENIKGSNGLTMNGEDLLINPAGENEIATKGSGRKPIVPNKLDYAVKVGMTTNTLVWKPEEKTSARNLIGAEKKPYIHSVAFSLEKGSEPVGNFAFLSSDETALTPTESGHIAMSPSYLPQIRGTIVLTYEGKIMQCFAEVDSNSTTPFIKALNYFTNEGNVQRVEPYFFLDTVTDA